jgi:hypothetical protein
MAGTRLLVASFGFSIADLKANPVSFDDEADSLSLRNAALRHCQRSGPRMKSSVNIAEAVTGDVRINFCGTDVGMAEKFLNDP